MAGLTPSPYELALLALAAGRVWKLVADDKVLNRPRDWLIDHMPWDELELFLLCPWCAGAWVSAGWYAAFLVEPDGTLVVAAFFAISLLVGVFGTWLERQTD